MKKKINLKLTASLVSLFISLIFIVLGSKNKYCMSFGLIFLGVAILMCMLYYKEKIEKTIIELDEKIDGISAEDDLENDDLDDDQIDDEIVQMEDNIYSLAQLEIRKKQLKKKMKMISIMFSVFGAAMVIFGFVYMM